MKGTEAVAKGMTHALRAVIGAAALVALGGLAMPEPVAAQTSGSVSASGQNTRTIVGERYVPGIWVDPDGCEHWVMDDGAEGYMSPHVTRQGIPVCRRGNTCGIMNTDEFFATDSYKITSQGRARLQEFFRDSSAVAFIIAGHTDSRASDAYNMRLSYNRASSVARVAQTTGARIADVRGYGERLPAASNATAGGMAKNRRVEIICIQ